MYNKCKVDIQIMKLVVDFDYLHDLSCF